MVNWLENILLAGFSFFMISAPYDVKYIGKVFFYVGLVSLILMGVLKYKVRFYLVLINANLLNKPFLLFAVLCFISIVLSLDFYHSQKVFFSRYLVYFVFFLCGVLMTRSHRKIFHALGFMFILSGLIFVAGGVSDFLYYSRVNPALAERVWSVFSKRIPYYSFPLYLVYFTPFIFALLLFTRNKWLKIIVGIELMLAFFCLITNGSRAAWLAILLAFIFIIFLKIGRVKGIILLFLVLFIFMVPTTFNKGVRLKTIIYPTQWSNRLPLYKSAILILRDYPLFGVGVGMFEKVLHFPKYELPENYGIPKELNLHAHNTYLEVAAEMGLLGLLSFLGIIVTFFCKAIKKIRNPGDMSKNTQAIFIGLSASVFAALVFAFSTTYITVGVNNSCYFWLLFGMAAGMLNKKDELKAKAGTVP